MSVQATSWALYSVEGLSPARRLILLVLADHAHNDGTAAFPSYATIADAVGLSKRQVMRQVADLEQLGLIRRGDQRHVTHIDRRYRPVVWDLALDPPARARNITDRAAAATRAPGRSPRTRPAGRPVTPTADDVAAVDSVDVVEQSPTSGSGDTGDTSAVRDDTSDTTGCGSGVTFSAPRGDIRGDTAMSPKPVNQEQPHASRDDHDADARLGELLQARIRENRERRRRGVPALPWTDLDRNPLPSTHFTGPDNPPARREDTIA